MMMIWGSWPLKICRQGHRYVVDIMCTPLLPGDVPGNQVDLVSFFFFWGGGWGSVRFEVWPPLEAQPVVHPTFLDLTTPLIVGGVMMRLTPKMSHSFIQNCCSIILQVPHHQGWNDVSKVEGKTNFSTRLKQSDGLTCLTLTPSPYFTTDLRHCCTPNAVRGFCSSL